MELSPQQGQAVKKVVNWFRNETENQQTEEIAGFAGTGKSTILPFIIDDIGVDEGEIAFCAPTGKAAKVMGRKLRDQGYSAIPTTIHSLIYQPKPQKAEVLERELRDLEVEKAVIINGEHPTLSIAANRAEALAQVKEIEKKIEIIKKDLDRAYDQDAPRFQLNPESRLVTGKVKLVVIDEGSMVGTSMAEDLESFGIPILVMGDPGQLPPVDEDPGFDLANASTMLTEIHRQAADNPVIHIATLIRKGERPEIGDYGNGVRVVRRREDRYTLDLDRDAQVICGTNKTRWKLTGNMRRAGGYEGLAPGEGEPLIMCKNSRQHPILVNGSQVFSAIDHPELIDGQSRFTIDVFDEEGRRFKMFAYQGLFEEHKAKVRGHASAPKGVAYRSKITDNHLDFAWAITCHKSQGSQWDEVIVHDESAVFREDADKWLYTAVTRTAGGLILIANE
ncbi:RecD/TraA family helicase [Citromicrobium phage vB_CbaS-RXM]|nr:RecD/TraA family helicase [Citromicrobium phage vB_CbaS-RXM]